MSIVVSHHDLDRRVVNRLRTIPLMSLQGSAYRFVVIRTKTDDAVPAIIKTHLMKLAGVKRWRLIMDAVMGAGLHRDSAGNTGGCGESRSRYETQQTYKC